MSRMRQLGHLDHSTTINALGVEYISTTRFGETDAFFLSSPSVSPDSRIPFHPLSNQTPTLHCQSLPQAHRA